MSGRLSHPSNGRRDRAHWNNWRRNIGPHVNGADCGDPAHEKYVANARAKLLLLGPTEAPTSLDCGCRFMAVWVEAWK